MLNNSENNYIYEYIKNKNNIDFISINNIDKIDNYYFVNYSFYQDIPIYMKRMKFSIKQLKHFTEKITDSQLLIFTRKLKLKNINL